MADEQEPPKQDGEMTEDELAAYRKWMQERTEHIKEQHAATLKEYRDQTARFIEDLEVKMKEKSVDLPANDSYQKLKKLLLSEIDKAQIGDDVNPWSLLFTVPACYYSFGYFIYGYLEGKGVPMYEVMGEKAWIDYNKYLSKIPPKLPPAPKRDVISPPDPNNASAWK